MEVYHTTATETITASEGSQQVRPIRFLEYVVVPPIRLVLDAILAHVGVGGSMAPGIRQLGEWSGVTLGLITDCLRQLDDMGIITYDGRTIMLLRDPDAAPETDRSADRSAADESNDLTRESDRSPDRSLCDKSADRANTRPSSGARVIDHLIDQEIPPHTPPMVYIHATAADSAAAHESLPRGGMQGGGTPDRSPDRSPAAAALADLGANETIIAAALRALPDLTPQQVADTHAWHAWRRERSGGRMGEGTFFTAITEGHIHGPPPDPARPIPVERYTAADPTFYRRGDDVSDLHRARPELADLYAPHDAPAPARHMPPRAALPARPELVGLSPPPRAAPNDAPPAFAPAYAPKWRGRP